MSRSRVAIGRIECLAAIGILVLVGLLVVPLISNVREASARTQCVGNLKQIGIAMHTAVDHNKTLPPVDSNYPDPSSGSVGTVLYHLLPYMERKAIHALSKDSEALTDIGGYTIQEFLCPWEPTRNTTLAEANYAPNYLGFGSCPGGDYSPAQIHDGSSNTLAFAERRGRNTAADIGAWAVRDWKTGAWVDYNPEIRYSAEKNTERRCCEDGQFNYQSIQNSGGTVGAEKLNIDGLNAVNNNWHQIHDLGIAVLLMDGGVFFKGLALDNHTWGRMVCPFDGKVLSSDWIK